MTFLADSAAEILAHPENYSPQSYGGPDPEKDGEWAASVIYADGTDPEDPALVSKMGLLANLSDIMLSFCPSFDTSSVYIAVPEGVHLSASTTSASWFEGGRLRSYDPRTRRWYQEAVETGDLVFTEGERDALTGDYCIECAMPVFGPDGSLQAVVGADLFLNEMEKVLQESSVKGEYSLLVNQNGHAVLAPQAAAFPLAEDERDGDLRESKRGLFGRIIDAALRGKDAGVWLENLEDGMYYISASRIETTGWVLVSAYSQAVSQRFTVSLLEQQEKIQTDSQAEYQSHLRRYRTIVPIILVAVMLLALGGALLLGRRIVKPLNTITERISSLNGENPVFKMEDDYRTGDEVEQLAQSFADMSRTASDYLDKVVKVTAEKERIVTELSLATEIQAAMLPHIFPAFPNRPDFDIYAGMDPAKEVGGDFYDYFLIDDDHLCMVIADVSGKGVPAALFMMASKIILQSVAMMGSSPAQILTKTNQALCSNNEADMFVTVWLGILELSTGRLTCANAGHEFPAIKHPGGRFELIRDRHGFVIGGFEDSEYEEYELKLEPGSKLFVYTDGVPEAMNEARELFGTDRMLDALNKEEEAGPEQLLQNVRDAVDDFVEGAEQSDDITMTALEYIGP